MKPRPLIIFFIFLTTGFYACREENQNHVEGSLTSWPDEQVVSNAEIELSAQKIEQGSYNSTFDIIDTDITDQNGKFEFTFEPMRVNMYRLRIIHDDFRTKTIEFMPEGLASEYFHNEQIVRQASLQVHIQNTYTPTSETDEFKIRIKDITDVCQNCSDASFRYFEGANVDTSIIFEVAGDDEVLLEYSADKENTIYDTQNVYCEPGDDNFIIINY